jgi:hypothetical protein
MAKRKLSQIQLPETLRFSGKSTTIHYQSFTSGNRLVPAGIAQINSGKDTTIGILHSHFDHCAILAMVRIVQDENILTLSDEDMDRPDASPWFLACGFYSPPLGQNQELWFVVNDQSEFYPVKRTRDSGKLGDLRVMNPKNVDPILLGSWRDLSEIDRILVETAIQGYLKKHGWTA